MCRFAAGPTDAASTWLWPSGGSTLDKLGDGCPFYESTSGASGQQGVGTDVDGNVIFSDNSESIVRVLYVGGSTMAAAIRAANANPGLTIMPGYVYPIIGAINSGVTSTTLSATPTLGTTTTLGNGITTVAIDPFGNIYISDFNQVDVLFFDIKTGYARKLIASGTLCAAKQDSVGDGCPVNNSNFACGASGMGIGISPQGDLYLADNTNLLIRKITATNLVPVTVGSTLTQTEILHGASGTTAIAAALAGTSPGITSGSVTCGAANADGTMDCTVPVTFTPSTPGQRSAIAAGMCG